MNKRKPEQRDYSLGDWSLQQNTGDTVALRIEHYAYFPNIQSQQWCALFPKPPATVSQELKMAKASLLSAKGTVPFTTVSEIGGQGRRFLRLDFAGSQSNIDRGAKVAADYVVQLSRRSLVEGKPLAPAKPLTAVEKKHYTARTPVIDWKAPVVAAWLKQHQLTRAAKEKPLNFAWRVALAIQDSLPLAAGDVPEHWRPAEVCSRKQGDGGGLGLVMTAALRANGIPARALVGGMVNLLGRHSAFESNNVRMEFYDASAGGWIPVDFSELAKRGDNGWTAFGADDSDFLTLHIDCDLALDTRIMGIQRTDLLQMPRVWVTGSGNGSSHEETVEWVVELNPSLEKVKT